ncbi:MAG: HEAT repeat domain-containing protein [Gemmatimonadaceae bacterium]
MRTTPIVVIALLSGAAAGLHAQREHCRTSDAGGLPSAASCLVTNPLPAHAVVPASHAVGAVQASPRAEAGTPHPDDPADSLYRDARTALNRRDYGRAAELFRALRERYPRSEYVPDAYYWEAFALYRAGDGENLRAAMRVLSAQLDRYPSAATHADAEVLATRIRGQLAREGNADPGRESARAEIARAASGGSGGSCDDADRDVRLEAINALQQMDPERALPILRKVLARRDECSASLREKALYIVAQQAPADRDEILFGVTKNDPSSKVRQLAVYYLSQSSSERAVEVLDEILRTSGDAALQEKALYALSQRRERSAEGTLRAVVERDGTADKLKDLAIYYLGQSRSAENTTFLRRVYGRLGSSQLREKVMYALAQMGGEENGRWLVSVAADSSQTSGARRTALYYLSQGDMPVASLVELYDRMRSREMRDQLIYFYSQRREREALDKLISIARTDPDRDLRKKAIYHLSQSKDPRAAQALLEIIDQ